MRYLYMPTRREELIARGHYKIVDKDGDRWGVEWWERYRNDGTPVQSWRSTLEGTLDGTRVVLVTHSVVSPEGLERYKMRWLSPHSAHSSVTVTFMPDSVIIHDAGTITELDLPPGYGFATPLPSLARFAFPFDLASEEREIGMTLYMRMGLATGSMTMRPVKFGYSPIGIHEFTVRAQSLRGRGWRMEVPGLPTSEGWFDRNGACLLLRVEGPSPWEGRLTDWVSFG